MPKIDLVEVMRKAPGRCGICNTTPNDTEGRPLPAIDTNVDVDWGNNLYICDECADVICDLKGRVDKDTHDKLQCAYEELEKAQSRLRDKYKTLETRFQAVIAGKKAERAHKKSKKKRRITA